MPFGQHAKRFTNGRQRNANTLSNFDIIETGARMFVLPALDYSAQGSYDKNAAQKMANLGADVAAITPKELAQWIAKIVL